MKDGIQQHWEISLKQYFSVVIKKINNIFLKKIYKESFSTCSTHLTTKNKINTIFLRIILFDTNSFLFCCCCE